MSFVSIIATEQWISAVSDGNLVEFDKEGNWQIKPGKKPSFFRISERQFIACTGSSEAWSRIKKEFPFKKEPYPLDKDMLNHLEDVVRGVPQNQQDVLLVVADATNRVTCRMISNQPDTKWTVIEPESGRTGTLFLAGKLIDEKKIRLISEEFNRLLQVHGKDESKQVVLAQRELNKIAATLDPTIGTRIYQLLINK